MRTRSILIAMAVCGRLGSVDNAFAADPPHFIVVPGIQDTADTDLVNALWVGALGCPTAAKVAASGTFTDPACLTGDPKDVDNQGLLLIKSGPTSNNALSGETISGVQGATLTELGYDIRDGSVCNAVAPRFDIFTSTGKYYKLGCAQLQPTTTPGTGWVRLRWKPAGGVKAVNVSSGNTETVSDTISLILIIFDQGQDKAPNSGIAILDNIDVNGGLVGRQ